MSADQSGYTKILVRDLRIDMLIGIHDHEKEKVQPVLVNIEAHLKARPGVDEIGDTLCYDTLIKAIQALAAHQHINLVETFAEEIAALTLKDDRVSVVTVRVEKIAVYEFAAAVGVEIRRARR